MSAPVRIQLRRTKGWRIPPDTVKVDRTTKWGNPFTHNHPHSRALRRPMEANLSVLLFRRMLEQEGDWSPIPLPWAKGKIPAAWTTIEDVRRELRGKNLACWCPLDQPCHADVLLELANATDDA